MTRLHLQAIGSTLICLSLLSPALASEPGKAPPDPTADPVMLTAGFLSAHPDLRFRLLALEKREQGKHDEAFPLFQRAAFYADKPSQAMVAELLWTGQGVTQDRALAYAWMDLAAERGYEGFLTLREHYWSQLQGDEREQAVALGQEIYARYGDQAAEPRLERILRRERRKTTGSRTGFTGNLRILVPTPAGDIEIDGSKFYDERYWDPAQYRAWHDAIWMKPRVANVSVGNVDNSVPATPAPPSRSPVEDLPAEADIPADQP